MAPNADPDPYEPLNKLELLTTSLLVFRRGREGGVAMGFQHSDVQVITANFFFFFRPRLCVSIWKNIQRN